MRSKANFLLILFLLVYRSATAQLPYHEYEPISSVFKDGFNCNTKKREIIIGPNTGDPLVKFKIKNDMLHGRCVGYSVKGYRIFQGTYKNNKAVGKWQVFDSLGNVLFQFSLDTISSCRFVNHNTDDSGIEIYYWPKAFQRYGYTFDSAYRIVNNSNPLLLLQIDWTGKSQIINVEYSNFWGGMGADLYFNSTGKLMMKQVTISNIFYRIDSSHTPPELVFDRPFYRYTDEVSEGDHFFKTRYITDSFFIISSGQIIGSDRDTVIEQEERYKIATIHMYKPNGFVDEEGNIVSHVSYTHLLHGGTLRNKTSFFYNLVPEPALCDYNINPEKSLAEIINCDSITPSIVQNFKITSFRISQFRNDEEVNSIRHSNGTLITPEVRKFFNSLRIGDEIILEADFITEEGIISKSRKYNIVK